jgi:hypothetical protein
MGLCVGIEVWDNLAPTGFGTADRPPCSNYDIPAAIRECDLCVWHCHQSAVSYKFRSKPHTGYLFILINEVIYFFSYFY